ncbi:MAG: hypothetical protein JNN12_01615 [Bacteroidetes Order II. Incertae sedis bacterium]|nr:hypothetical protein [Bacteroidetes Order II. bacterium]
MAKGNLGKKKHSLCLKTFKRNKDTNLVSAKQAPPLLYVPKELFFLAFPTLVKKIYGTGQENFAGFQTKNGETPFMKYDLQEGLVWKLMIGFVL